MPTYDPTPGAYPFSSTTTINGSDIEGLVTNNVNPEQTFSVLNGKLDADNAAAGMVVQAEHTQRGSYARLVSASSTQDIDLFHDVFVTGLSSDFTNINTIAKTLPGSAIRFYMPWDGDILFMWTLFGTNNDPQVAKAGGSWGPVRTSVFFSFDGTARATTGRRIRHCVDSQSVYEHTGYRKSRVYSGHYLETSVTRGWHDGALKAFSVGVGHSRFWARNVVALLLKSTPKTS